MNLVELFEPVDLDIEWRPGRGDKDAYASFRLGDDKSYEVKFEEEDGVVDVAFTLSQPGATSRAIHLTGTGDAVKVISSVLQSIRGYVSKYNPSTLHFSADKAEVSRVRLYDAIVKRMGVKFTRVVDDEDYTIEWDVEVQ